MFSANDATFMARAIQLAKKGRFTTSPNPSVGCVIVSENGEFLSEGFHLKAGENHAEINALKAIHYKAKNTTAYVSLEPCSHYGKTPPCCDAFIEAQIRRVVVAMEDPHDKVAGRGIAKMREAGIKVDVGLLTTDAEKINPGFYKRQRTGLPRVTLKLAATLDGKTALLNGQSKWITGPLARQDVQVHRAQCCAILSGSGTVIADDPSLNVRHSELPQTVADQYRKLVNYPAEIRQPLRVILDGRGQLHPNLNVFADDNVLVVNLKENLSLSEKGIKQWQAPVSKGKIDLKATLRHLGELDLNNIWLEAGARLAGAFVQESLIDEFILYLAPKIMGDKSFSLLELPAFSSMKQVPELEITDTKMVGQDIKLTGHFKQSST